MANYVVDKIGYENTCRESDGLLSRVESFIDDNYQRNEITCDQDLYIALEHAFTELGYKLGERDCLTVHCGKYTASI